VDPVAPVAPATVQTVVTAAGEALRPRQRSIRGRFRALGVGAATLRTAMAELVALVVPR
jgi:hypothetical protein